VAAVVVLVALEHLQIQLELPVPEVMVVLVVLDYQIALQEVRSFMLVVEAALEAAQAARVLLVEMAAVVMKVRMELMAKAVVEAAAEAVQPAVTVEMVLLL
jgi:hypothetical protein